MLSVTEQINPQTTDIDLCNGAEIAQLINNEDKKVAKAVQKIIPQIGEAIEEIAKRLLNGGKMAYFGSGTSGRIGILDASEMTPTYGVAPELIQGFISGGDEAIRFAVENAEDNVDFALQDFNNFNPQKNDVVVAISASGSPAYTFKILQSARQKGVLTIAVTSNPNALFKQFADIFLCAYVGPEAITGSSRMKSGTAQKMIINMLSTGAMIKIGKTYHNYMVDLQIHNKKLYQRAIRFICDITKTDLQTAEKTLQQAQNVKIACVMIAQNCNAEKAAELLKQQAGILRRVI